MKISLAWVFDHIDYDYKKSDVDEIVTKFNQVTAEIEGVDNLHDRYSIDTKSLFVGIVKVIEKEHVVLTVPELKKDVELSKIKSIKIGQKFLLSKCGKDFSWATCRDVGLEKDGLLPDFDISAKDAGITSITSGSWRKLFESEDAILDVDNKSLTHRPDMWGHRGFAREIAAFLELPFRPKEHFLSEIKVKNYSKKSKSTKEFPFSIEIKTPACKRFSALHFDEIENRPSNLFIASRLIKVGVRPINGIVDLTNYVMLDWSQPVHAYDAEKISNKLVARMATGRERLDLLDGEQVELTKEDLVIADDAKVVGLAGIMGGLHDSIDENTTSVLFESANFDPSCVRHSSIRHGVRTESSARFEKTLDPNQTTDAIARFVALCEQVNIKTKISGDVVCVGDHVSEKTIGVTHSFLERRSGVKLEKSDVIEPLTRLGFVIVDTPEALGEIDDTLYTITIPSFRATKDIDIAEDILEEVMRFFGFENIALQLPLRAKMPGDMTNLFRRRKIAEFLVNAARMSEQKNYLYYDESFLKEVGLDVLSAFDDCLTLKNPVSENNRRIASSLLLNLFKNIKENCVNENSLRFFEFGRVCRKIKKEIEEKKMLTGIFFEKRKDVDFYECKSHIDSLLKICDIDDAVESRLSGRLSWQKLEKRDSSRPWAMLYQSVELFLNNVRIGTAGKVDKTFLSKLDCLSESDAFFFDLDLDKLLGQRKSPVVYTPISKFPGITFDLCFIIPVSVTVSSLESILLDSDDLIERVQLIDFFDKEDFRSVAFRVWASDPEKTLLKEEIESIRQNACKSAEKEGAQLR